MNDLEKAANDLVKDANKRRTPSRISVILGDISAIWFVLMILSTLTGAWIKIYWIGWVFAR